MIRAEIYSNRHDGTLNGSKIMIPANTLTVGGYLKYMRPLWDDHYWRKWGPSIMFSGSINMVNFTNCPYCGTINSTEGLCKAGCPECGAELAKDENSFGYDPNTGWTLPMSKEAKTALAAMRRRVKKPEPIQPKRPPYQKQRRKRKTNKTPTFASQIRIDDG